MKRPTRGGNAKQRGRKACRDGVPFQACPETGLGDWQDWRAGWNAEQDKAEKAKAKEK
jgi:hypothetical protein